MTRTHAIAGVMFAALLMAAIVTFRPHWPASSPPQGIEIDSTSNGQAPLENGEAVKEDFVLQPRVVQTIPIQKPGSSAQPPQPTSSAPSRVEPPPQATTPPSTPVEPADAKPEPERQAEASVAVHDVCAKYGGHRIEFKRGRYLMWKCIYPGRR